MTLSLRSQGQSGGSGIATLGVSLLCTTLHPRNGCRAPGCGDLTMSVVGATAHEIVAREPGVLRCRWTGPSPTSRRYTPCSTHPSERRQPPCRTTSQRTSSITSEWEMVSVPTVTYGRIAFVVDCR